MTYTNTIVDASTARLDVLFDMLSYRRPEGSKSERRFIRDYLLPLGVQQDKAGNLIKRIGDAPIMWSCHTDTVHRQGGYQRLELAGDLIGLPKDTDSNCLGADDTAGIWLMRELILAGKPGLYVFHRGEERGGKGSSWIANHTPALVKDIECAIALDRRGTGSVITHQGYGRSCSDLFAQSLADQLPGYKLDDGGVFTDTANYIDIVGECTNLSVGYYSEHTSSECLDVEHLQTLRDALLELDADKLVYSRVPGDDDDDGCRWWSEYRKEDWTNHLANDNAYGSDKAQARSLLYIVQDHPQQVADLLEEYGFDWQSLAQEVYTRGGS